MVPLHDAISVLSLTSVLKDFEQNTILELPAEAFLPSLFSSSGVKRRPKHLKLHNLKKKASLTL